MSAAGAPLQGFDLRALAKLMAECGLEAAVPLRLEPIPGGQSNPTYRIRGKHRDFVLRKKPPGVLLPSAHAVDREYRIMKALRPSEVRVPEMHLYSDDLSIVGTPFYIMEFLDGRVMLDQSLPGMTPAERSEIYWEMNRTIAALHRIDPGSLGLSDYGKAGNYFARQIARWTRQFKDSKTEDIPQMDALMEWLPEHIPPGDQASIVHGDFRLDNLVFEHTRSAVMGVLDWELSTLGHPLADFSYHCMSWHIPPALWRGIGGLDLESLGIPSEKAYIARYCASAGTSAEEHWDFYLAYNLFRIAAILQGVAKRAQAGIAAASDAVETGRKARPLAVLGWQFAERYRHR